MIVIRPRLPKGLDSVEAWHDTMYGRVESKWRRKAGALEMSVVIPPNTTATVYVPGSDVRELQGAKPARSESGASVFTLGSGSYSFTAKQ